VKKCFMGSFNLRSFSVFHFFLVGRGLQNV
jgi:hypothetical protein